MPCSGKHMNRTRRDVRHPEEIVRFSDPSCRLEYTLYEIRSHGWSQDEKRRTSAIFGRKRFNYKYKDDG